MSVTKPLSIKERKIVKAYVETGDRAKAAMQVGDYSSVQSASIMGGRNIEKFNTSSRIEQLCNNIGLTEHYIISKIKEKTEALETKFFSHNGMVTDSREVASHHTQLKALDMALEIRGMKVTHSTALNLNLTCNDLQGLRSNDLAKMIKECEQELKQLEDK